MPIYEYLCGACGHTLDALQKISEDPLVHCPTCGAPELKRQLSAPRFRLKGSGWYETDFKGQGDKKRNLADSDSKAAGDSKPDKSESKPEPKPESKPAESRPTPAAESKPAKPAGKAGDSA